jgi:hypothetical protein
MKFRIGIAIVATMLIAGESKAAAQSSSRPMSFEKCIATIQVMSERFGAPENIVETSILRIVRYHTSDGSVLVTCAKPDRKMVVTQSTRR